MTVRSERPTLYWVPVCQTGHVWKNTYVKNGTNFSDTAVGFFMSLLCSICHLFPTAKVFKIVCQCFLQVIALTIAPVWIWNLSQHARVRSKSDPVGFFMSLLCSICHLFPTAKVFKIVCQCFLQVIALAIAPVWISILRICVSTSGFRQRLQQLLSLEIFHH